MISDVLERCARCHRIPRRLDQLDDHDDAWWRVACGCARRWVLVASTSDRPRTRCPATDERDTIERALEMWRAAKPTPGTPVEAYLREVRRIPPPYPSTIRFLARAWHAESSRRHPAMLGAVQAPDGRLRAVHRTFLTEDGSAKAPVDPAKKVLGRCAGGSVRLARATERLAIAEGIETSLSVMHATKLPTWASLSTSGMRSLIVPPLPLAREILVFADGDRPGIEAAKSAASRFHREGRRVRIVAAPNGRDFNDLLRGAA